MVYFKTAQEWLDQSKLLLEARPATTKITTRYSITAVKPRPAEDPKPPRGSLVFKTYDPISGVALKYKTNKAYEVSRLIQSNLGSLGRGMAAVPEPVVEEAMADAPAVEEKAPVVAQAGGGKKKKKGKK